ncbi:unnamed protein product [Adineta steineri]|uniref:Transmembrane protein n=1 Tax=Adineta steineri TaxID=433720 RepID=A0A815E434_9BILA|nr:unnamed protein product [Adineta steineri]
MSNSNLSHFDESNQSDEEDNKQLLQQFINRTFEQNSTLLKIIDRLIRQQSTEHNRSHCSDLDGSTKFIIIIIFLWILTVVCQQIIEQPVL